jgi:hypothetical protein
MTDRKQQTNRRETRLEKPSVEQKQGPASAPQVQGSLAGNRSSPAGDAVGSREAATPQRTDRSAAVKPGGEISTPSSDLELLLVQEVGPNWGCGAHPRTIAAKDPSHLDASDLRQQVADRAKQIAAKLKRAVRILSRSREGFEELVPHLGNEAKDRLAGKLHRLRVLIDEMVYFLGVDEA